MPGRSRRRAMGPEDAPEKKVSATGMTRLTFAQAGIDHTKGVLPHGAGNQLEALRETNFNSYFRMAAMRDPECWELDASVADLADRYPAALTAAQADLAQGGNCGEHATIAYDFLRMHMSEDTVNRCSVNGLDHAFLLLGDVAKDADDELAVCDPWPTAPTACLWEDHFAFTEDRDEIKVAASVSGDDADIKSAIAQGLRLSPKGEAWIAHAFDEDRTEEEIKKGREGDKPWIWRHENAASEEFRYTEEEAEQSQAASGSETEAAVPEQLRRRQS